jgi:hypothetical protein
MADRNSTPAARAEAAALVPRHVRNLNAIAERNGLAVEMTVEECEDAPEEGLHLFAVWVGTREQLFATRLISEHQQRRIQVAIRRFDLVVPSSTPWYRTPMLDGWVSCDGERCTAALDFGEAPIAIQFEGDVEVTTCKSGRWCNGTAAAIARLIDPRRIPTGKRATRSSGPWDDHLEAGVVKHARQWTCRRMPDGEICYWEQSELDYARREKERREALLEARKERLEQQERYAPRHERLTPPPLSPSDNICVSMRLIEHMDLSDDTVGVAEITRLAAELRAALARATVAVALQRPTNVGGRARLRVIDSGRVDTERST